MWETVSHTFRPFATLALRRIRFGLWPSSWSEPCRFSYPRSTSERKCRLSVLRLAPVSLMASPDDSRRRRRNDRPDIDVKGLPDRSKNRREILQSRIA